MDWAGGSMLEEGGMAGMRVCGGCLDAELEAEKPSRDDRAGCMLTSSADGRGDDDVRA